MILLNVLFADDVALAKLQEVFDTWKSILEDHGIRVSESKLSTFSPPLSDPQASSSDIIIMEGVMAKCTTIKYQLAMNATISMG